MPRYEKHPFDEGKFQSTFDEYVHGEGNGKSRQSINRRFRKIESTSQTPPKPVEEILEVLETPTANNNESEDAYEWLSFDEDIVDSEPRQVSSLPLPARNALRLISKDMEIPTTPKERDLYFKKQAVMLRYIAAGLIDPTVSLYCRAVMGDKGKDWKLTRTNEDWELFEMIAQQWCEHRGISIPVSPDMMMIGCVGAFYIPPVVNAHRKRDPNRPTLFRRVKEKVGRWKARRKLKKSEKINPFNEGESDDA